MRGEKILAIDIGGGTQDILLYDPEKRIENCVKLVLPSPTVLVSQQIEEATRNREPVFLYGNLMGGGPCTRAIRRHLAEGLQVYATPLAAKTIKDDLEIVQALGVEIVEEQPPGTKPIRMGDVDLDTLQEALGLYGVKLPRKYAVAVQDHGESIGESNRLFRFRHWRRFIEDGGRLEDLAYQQIPSYLTRMRAVQQDAPGAMVMDTGSAAIWGALCDPQVSKRLAEGIIVVNIGNQHTVAVLIKERRVMGLFEHHTGLMNKEKLGDYLDRFRRGVLSHEEVFSDGGHGSYISSEYNGEEGFEFWVVTGPNRYLAEGLPVYFAVPYGDMMLSGCFGLVAAYNEHFLT
ncbi:hypothetical protein TherJR_2365 [Calderihabitans maritimus]|uniref:Pyruvate formate lyase-activating protein n=1 Tax=Calderihabitans maritimus TaxID=1246530 RepID=A0A1Z5HSV2_9FIRM|nr:hypothetical protein TherJR_2365 [Calderihabitans maritimus]